MPKQMTFASLVHAFSKTLTRRETFLAAMTARAPLSPLLALIEPMAEGPTA